ncbi:hypothetical protein L1987_24459 [Smallanthus sonchifolius]|uniref:Uncharacterized protein n=1 Tax=Smallanthus sonchifolius TaxID=185202 RepID=A0ACB9IJQ1_9ASTR|nr:hypothetical protein L1987_24459 [Smallanthus sonchifolius]
MFRPITHDLDTLETARPPFSFSVPLPDVGPLASSIASVDDPKAPTFASLVDHPKTTRSWNGSLRPHQLLNLSAKSEIHKHFAIHGCMCNKTNEGKYMIEQKGENDGTPFLTAEE